MWARPKLSFVLLYRIKDKKINCTIPSYVEAQLDWVSVWFVSFPIKHLSETGKYSSLAVRCQVNLDMQVPEKKVCWNGFDTERKTNKKGTKLKQ